MRARSLPAHVALALPCLAEVVGGLPGSNYWGYLGQITAAHLNRVALEQFVLILLWEFMPPRAQQPDGP